MRFRRAIMTSALFAIAACSVFTSLDGLSGAGDAATQDAIAFDGGDAGAGDASFDAIIDAPEGGCASLHGPAMIRVPAGGGFCIDSTEVTNADYAAFVAAVVLGAPVPSPDSGVCKWNGAIAPSGCAPDVTDSVAHPNRPVSCVDWCDAYAYCAWAGKRLCGTVDGGGIGFTPFTTPANTSYLACTANVTQPFPYGAAYSKGACNTADLASDAAAPVAADVKSFTGCVGGYPGLYDLTGNVSEWMDACEDRQEGGANDRCRELGDSFDHSTSAPARCDNYNNDIRNWRVPNVGIRCCAAAD